jgi:hypothetical protein
MSDPGYAPFPEQELETIATVIGPSLSGVTMLSTWECDHIRKTCRAAIASYKALNERCLRAELERDHGVKS